MVLPFNSSLYINYEKDRIYIEPRCQTHVDPVTRIVQKSRKKLDASGLNSLKTAAMLVSQTSSVGVELLSYANAFFCSKKFA